MASKTSVLTRVASESSDFVSFGDVARNQLGQQCQYAVRYTGLSFSGDGVHDPRELTEMGYPDLGKGLRFHGNANSYHSVRIHKDDVAEFVRRFKQHRGS